MVATARSGAISVFRNSRTCMRPRRMLDFTVPMGMFNRFAISLWVRPYKNPSSSTCRCSGRNASIARIALSASKQESDSALSSAIQATDSRTSAGVSVKGSAIVLRSRSIRRRRAIVAIKHGSEPKASSKRFACRQISKNISWVASSASAYVLVKRLVMLHTSPPYCWIHSCMADDWPRATR